MTPLRTGGTFALLDLGSVTLAYATLDGLVGTPGSLAELALFLGAVFAASTALLGEAVAVGDGAAVDVLSRGLLLRRLGNSNIVAEEIVVDR